jgi:flavin-dependent dehydrogenase
MAHDADVIVIGAGPAGCAAAIPLVQAGHDVLVLERRPDVVAEDIGSGEVLAPATQHECLQLGVALEGPWLLDHFDAVRNVYPDLSYTVHPLPDGFRYVHVERNGFHRALRARLQQVGGRIRFDSRVSGVSIGPDEVVVKGAGDAAWTAPMLIDAGGRNAPTLASLRLKTDDPEFSQIGVALFFSDFDGARPFMWDRHFFGHRGAMMSGGRIRPGLFRFILEADLADKQADRARPVEFYERTAERFDPWLWDRIRRSPRVGEPWCMAPIGYRVTEVARDRLLLAGDASGYLAPLTGQGIEFAMRMGRIAAATTHDALASGDFSRAAFERYIRDREDEMQTAMTYLRHMLHGFRDRDRLLRAAHDDSARMELFGPMAMVVADQGRLAC